MMMKQRHTVNHLSPVVLTNEAQQYERRIIMKITPNGANRIDKMSTDPATNKQRFVGQSKVKARHDEVTAAK